jgi:hypothetical protein
MFSLPTSFLSFVQRNESLDAQLHRAASRPDRTACRYLLDMRANVNAKNESGKTALQIALSCKNLLIGKIFIDRGADVTETDKEEMGRIFSSLRMDAITHKITQYMIKRPNPYALEVLSDSGHFEPLTLMASSSRLSSFTRPIFLVNIGDEDMYPHYGAVTKNFENFPREEDELEKYFTVIRVLVDDKNRLAKTIDLVQELLPGLPIAHWILNNHAHQHAMDVGIQSTLQEEDHTIMREIAKRVHPLGTITLYGCLSAEGNDHLTQHFSKNGLGRIVYGSPICPRQVNFSIFYGKTVPLDFVIPFFSERGEESGVVRVYQKGKEIATGSGEDVSSKIACYQKIHAVLPVSPTVQSDSHDSFEEVGARQEDTSSSQFHNLEMARSLAGF